MVDVAVEGSEGEQVGAGGGDEEVAVYGVVWVAAAGFDPRRSVVGPGPCVHARAGCNAYGGVLGSEAADGVVEVVLSVPVLN